MSSDSNLQPASKRLIVIVVAIVAVCGIVIWAVGSALAR